jgi:hypothetical protein
MGIFCGRQHPLFDMDDAMITPAELRRHSFVATEVTQEEAYSEFVRGLMIRATAPTILSRMLLVLSSRYLGVVPISFAQHWVEKGDIRELRAEAQFRTKTEDAAVRQRLTSPS